MGHLDGSTLLLLLALGMVGAILWAADSANRATLARFTWSDVSGFWPGIGQVYLVVRHVSAAAPIPAMLALDRSDLSPLSYRHGCDDECTYCRTFVPHTAALCIATFDRHGRPDSTRLPYWMNHARDVRAALVPADALEACA